MDEYKHCLNTILSRSIFIKLALEMNPNNKEYADKEYEKLLKWFKDTYYLKRKRNPNTVRENGNYI